MKNLIKYSLILLTTTLMLSACSLHKNAADSDAAQNASQFDPKQLTPAELQAAFTKASTPTKEHAFLQEFVGNWWTRSKFWMTPDSKPEESKGYSSNSMEMQGKFLRQNYKGKFNGKSFNGVGYTGFDTVSNEFTSTWIDSMSTAIMTSTGSYDPTTKTLTLTGIASCPLTPNGKRQVKSTIRIVDKNRFVYEMFDLGPDGKEVKNLEITYNRITK